MTEAIFESFINHVYAGGTAIEVFDNHVNVLGGANDITVQSIFGAAHESDNDSDSDSERKTNHESKRKSNRDSESDSAVVAPMNLTLDNDEDSIVSEFSLKLDLSSSEKEGKEVNEKKSKCASDIVGAMDLTIAESKKDNSGSLSAKDVASMLSVYTE